MHLLGVDGHPEGTLPRAENRGPEPAPDTGRTRRLRSLFPWVTADTTAPLVAVGAGPAVWAFGRCRPSVAPVLPSGPAGAVAGRNGGAPGTALSRAASGRRGTLLPGALLAGGPPGPGDGRRRHRRLRDAGGAGAAARRADVLTTVALAVSVATGSPASPPVPPAPGDRVPRLGDRVPRPAGPLRGPGVPLRRGRCPPPGTSGRIHTVGGGAGPAGELGGDGGHRGRDAGRGRRQPGPLGARRLPVHGRFPPPAVTARTSAAATGPLFAPARRPGGPFTGSRAGRHGRAVSAPVAAGPHAPLPRPAAQPPGERPGSGRVRRAERRPGRHRAGPGQRRCTRSGAAGISPSPPAPCPWSPSRT